MANFIEGRESVIEYLRRELVGPVEIGDPLACEPNGAVVFDDVSDLFKNWHQEGSEQEILQRDNPCHRYGVGVLYPSGITNEEMET
ncbi:MAG: hypothetical protein GX963_13755, partial [Bacteroidales bacterium]|nr:hypothetical protein [Bacteroidales bacterium]